ncbi:uncharacterized protein B0H18DRAFT_246357 [Fomitopsis serialis]|uniref:uncharacterized protein n=1 Tax=Fomitopsis serialis TaxID=139415 RepID=UPI002007C174|nr:uncharacterized protein B0H18DRAFT_246357 [Neoantrodia serialis]KAH9928707.1 hypothetical protein B0H18DRAFT_246357 [Neoantrodia serialis]
MNVFAIGASRNIGYHAARRLLAKGAIVTFLLRSTSVFDDDEAIQPHIRAGTARLVKGDALKAEDVKRGWEAAQGANNDTVDLVLFSVGGVPSFYATKGFIITPPNLCTQSFLNLVTTMPTSLRAPSAQPRFVAISSIGLSRASHAELPLLLKPFYGYFLRGPHADKLAMERVIAHCAGWEWTHETPDTEALPSDWTNLPGLPAFGELQHVVAVRPALLTSGACKADKKDGKEPYRVKDCELGDGYTVSREDTAHFLVEGLLPHWDQWEGKRAHIAY